MAIVWHAQRDTSEATAPPTIGGVTPIEGGVLLRHDDVADNVWYCFYILVRKPTSGAGVYRERWRVQAADRSAIDAGPYDVNETIGSNSTELLLLPPATATDKSVRDLPLGNLAAPTDAQLIGQVNGWSTAIRNNFSPVVTRAVYNSDVAGAHGQAEFV